MARRITTADGFRSVKREGVMTRSSRWRVFGVLVAMALVLQACANSTSTNLRKTLVVGQPFDVASLDPHRMNEHTTVQAEGQMYETLLHLDPNDPSRLIPGLALTWTANADLTVFTFNLRKNAVFSTGNPVTADDVKFSLDRLWNLQASPAFIMTDYKSIDVIDPYTVRITKVSPDAAFLAKMTFTMCAIIDSKVAKEHGAVSDITAITADKAEAFFNTPTSIGSGPYMFGSYAPNDRMVLVRNPKYWGPAPAIDKIILQSVPEVAAERQLLESGSIDIATGIDYPTASQLEQNKGINISYVPTLSFIYLFMTASPQISKPLSNPLVRQAVERAIDYKGILALANGHAQRPPTTIALGMAGADTVPPIQENLDEAKQLLAQAGYPNGFEVPFPYGQSIDYNIDRGLVATKLQSDLARVGIKLDLQPLSGTAALEKFRSGTMPFGISGWDPDYVDPDTYVGTMWASPVNFLTKRLHYKNPAVDQLWLQSLSTSGAARVQVYKQLQEIFQKDAVLQALIQPDFIMASSDKVSGYKFGFEQRVFDFSTVSIRA